MKVPYINLAAQYRAERDTLLPVIEGVLEGGRYVQGDIPFQLEERLGRYLGTPHIVTVRSCTDALIMSLRDTGVGPGDEVITVPNSYFATAEAIAAVGARPVFVDVGEDLNMAVDRLADVVTSRTKAVIPVHLTGRMADMDRINAFAQDAGLTVIEDAAQSFGARKGGVMAGTAGRYGCFSAHPLKPLNAVGDAGFIVVPDEESYGRMLRYRSHGQLNRNEFVEWGINCRLDVLQCAVLMERLKFADAYTERRRRIADIYRENISAGDVMLPTCRPDEFNIFHTFTILAENRDGLQKYLQDRGIGSAIHYPIPIHLQKATASLGYAAGDFPMAEKQSAMGLSLPIHPFLDDEQVLSVCNAINAFYGVQRAG